MTDSPMAMQVTPSAGTCGTGARPHETFDNRASEAWRGVIKKVGRPLPLRAGGICGVRGTFGVCISSSLCKMFLSLLQPCCQTSLCDGCQECRCRPQEEKIQLRSARGPQPRPPGGTPRGGTPRILSARGR
jgi:hypothetical protein